MVPDNCSFDMASAQGYWDFMENQKADFIFQRFVGCLMDYRAIIELMNDNLEVGGWVELHEWVIDFQSARPGSLEGTALKRWSHLLQQGKKTKPPMDPFTFYVSFSLRPSRY